MASQHIDETFKPYTNEPNLDAIFNNQNSVTNDQASRKFFNRLRKAREEDEYKKQRPTTKLSHKHSTSMDDYPLMSMKHQNLNNSMLMMKKTLHQKLHALNIPEDMFVDEFN